MPKTAGGVIHVDTSALVKLVVRETESEAVEVELERWAGFATSSLTSVELSRAVLRARADGRSDVAKDETVRDLLRAFAEVPVSVRVLAVARQIEPPLLRTLDAIHLASALALGADLGAVLTYDQRLAEAAEGHELKTLAPGSGR